MLPGPRARQRNAALAARGQRRAAVCGLLNPPVTAICTPVACADPRLRSVRLGESSTESASDAVAAPALAGTVSLARYAAAPAHRLPLQARHGRTAPRTVDGNAAVGASFSGRSKVSVASRLWLARRRKAAANQSVAASVDCHAGQRDRRACAVWVRRRNAAEARRLVHQVCRVHAHGEAVANRRERRQRKQHQPRDKTPVHPRRSRSARRHKGLRPWRKHRRSQHRLAVQRHPHQHLIRLAVSGVATLATGNCPSEPEPESSRFPAAESMASELIPAPGIKVER